MTTHVCNEYTLREPQLQAVESKRKSGGTISNLEFKFDVVTLEFSCYVTVIQSTWTRGAAIQPDSEERATPHGVFQPNLHLKWT